MSKPTIRYALNLLIANILSFPAFFHLSSDDNLFIDELVLPLIFISITYEVKYKMNFGINSGILVMVVHLNNYVRAFTLLEKMSSQCVPPFAILDTSFIVSCEEGVNKSPLFSIAALAFDVEKNRRV
jgi:hypothetical protein